VGQGTKIPSLIEIFPLHDDQEDRSDALAGVAAFASTLRWRAADRSIPTSYRNSAERVVAELEALSGGGGTFTALLRHLVAWRLQEDLKPEGDRLQRFSKGRRELPPQWFGLLERELDGPEWRLGLGTGSPYASLADIALLLADRIDADLLHDLQKGIPGSTAPACPRSPNPKNSSPGSRPTTSPGCCSTSGASMSTFPSRATATAGSNSCSPAGPRRPWR
jgi:hypothetical protein